MHFLQSFILYPITKSELTNICWNEALWCELLSACVCVWLRPVWAVTVNHSSSLFSPHLTECVLLFPRRVHLPTRPLSRSVPVRPVSNTTLTERTLFPTNSHTSSPQRSHYSFRRKKLMYDKARFKIKFFTTFAPHIAAGKWNANVLWFPESNTYCENGTISISN